MKSRLSCSILNFIFQRLRDQELLQVTQEGLETIRQAGFIQAELYFRYPDSQMARLVQQKAVDLGLVFPSIHFAKSMLEREKEKALGLMPGFLNLAGSLGAKLGVLHPPIQKGYQAGIRETVAFLEKVVPLAQRNNLILSLETVPIPQAHLFLAEITRDFSRETVQVTLDLKFQAATGIPLEVYFETLPGRITNLHVNDYAGSLQDEQGRRLYPFPGRGQIDFARVAAILKNYCYKGLLTLETSLQGFEDRYSRLVEAKEILKRLGDG